MDKVSFYSLTIYKLKEALQKEGLSVSKAEVLFQKCYKRFEKSIFCDHDISKNEASFFNIFFSLDLPKVKTVQKSQDGTVKFLIQLADGKTVESVLLPFRKKYVTCLSTQVGCAMGCTFCLTGTQGFERNLTVEEIISQYMILFSWLKDNISKLSPSPNIVFMGQGEPLHNFSVLKKSIEIFKTVEGLYLGPRQITVSTVGYIPGLKRLGELGEVNIALSLHSPFNDKRSEIIPHNDHVDFNELMGLLDEIPLKKKQYLMIEYLLISSFNDRQEDAKELIFLFKDRPVIINLIPYNPIDGKEYQRPSVEHIHIFKKWLVNGKLQVMLRETKGDDILAACGQLKSE